MNVTISKQDSITTASVDGTVDSGNSKKFEQAVTEALDSGVQLLVIDLAACNFMSSAGIRVILICAKRLHSADGKLVITGLNEYMNKVFGIAGLHSVLAIEPALSDGVRRLHESS